MTARHVDLAIAAGETPNLGLRYHRVGASVALSAVVAGDWVFYQDDPWPVYSVTPASATAVRVRLGRGQFWEPDVIARGDTLALEATPEPIAEAFVNYRTNAGQWAPVPFGLAAGATELRVLPPDAASATFTATLAADAEAGGPTSYEWEASARFASGGQWVRLAEGALMFVPSIVRA